MTTYDVIIVGAGIAGTGLAYNLRYMGFKGTILLIDKKGIATNRAHSTKTIFKKLIEEYKFPYFHKYKGIIFTSYDEPFTLEHEVYSSKYEDMCEHLLINSNVDFMIAHAREVDSSENTLYTNKGKYGFKLLVDCTGGSFFLRKKYKLPTSDMWWMAKLMILENTSNVNTDYMYWLTDERGYTEEFCPYPDHVAVGDYQYTSKKDFNQIKSPKNLLRNKFIRKQEVITKSIGIIPNTPHFPLYFKKKFIFLGDSFGNAPTSSCYGAEAILETSKILSYCIVNNKLDVYESMWKKKYLESYIKYLVVKYDMYRNTPLLARIKNYPKNYSYFKIFKKYPEQVLKYLEDPSYVFECTKELSQANKFPFRQKLFRLYYYSFLKTRAFFEGLRKF